PLPVGHRPPAPRPDRRPADRGRVGGSDTGRRHRLAVLPGIRLPQAEDVLPGHRSAAAHGLRGHAHVGGEQADRPRLPATAGAAALEHVVARARPPPPPRRPAPRPPPLPPPSYLLPPPAPPPRSSGRSPPRRSFRP